MPRILMHISDLHAGSSFNAEKADAIIQHAHDLQPDLLVLSGDMVDWGEFTSQWKQIRAFIDRLPEPRLIVPGNHDIPIFNMLARYLWPFRQYHKNISPDLEPVWEAEGMAVLGVNTVRASLFSGGRLGRKSREQLAQRLACYTTDICKVIVMHHHIVEPPGPRGYPSDAIIGARETLAVLDRGRADLVLCGHLHTSYVGHTMEFDASLRGGTVIAQCGTSTSRRGPLKSRSKNAFNIITIGEQVIGVAQYMYFDQEQSFLPVAEHLFPRRASGVHHLRQTGS